MNPPDSTPLAEDSFENRLRNTPRRPAPSEWREPILTAATATAAQRFPSSSISRTAPLDGRFRHFWDVVAAQIPMGWVGFAGVWLLILASSQFDFWLNGAPSRSGHSPAISVRFADFGKYRTELMRVAELLPEFGQPERIPPPVEPPPTVRPHSQRDSLPQPFGGVRRPSEVLPA